MPAHKKYATTQELQDARNMRRRIRRLHTKKTSAALEDCRHGLDSVLKPSNPCCRQSLNKTPHNETSGAANECGMARQVKNAVEAAVRRVA